jgi:hypothetical protein
MSIETSAILCQSATADKSCPLCVYSESNIATGLHCDMFDLPTRQDKRCGVFIAKRKEKTEVKETQIDLF